MTLFEKINNDLKEAMKTGDKFKLSVIRMLKSALQLEITKKGKDETLSDEEVITIVKRNIKQRESSIEEYTKYEKMDKVSDLKKEIDILNIYLPAQLSDEEIEKEVLAVIKETGATSLKEMGIVMKTLTSKIGNSADMSKVSSIVKEKLS